MEWGSSVSERVVALRHALHRYPERSGAEAATAARIVRFFEPLNPDKTVRGLGGHGVAFVFAGAAPGPTVLLRCELDALPIEEGIDLPYRSEVAGTSHKCGHDGHMAILAAVGEHLAGHRPARGRAVLLFQPAEENGAGAAAVLADARFAPLMPDVAFALHNVPGYPLGEVLVRAGTAACASRGMAVTLYGLAAHAAHPEAGRNPAAALCRIMAALGHVPSPAGEHAFATIVGARLGGEEAYGISPGEALLGATLRSETNETMQAIVAYAEAAVRREAERAGLRFDIDYREVFSATVNAGSAVEVVQRAAAGRPVRLLERPFRWSEDFGGFTAAAEGAFFGLGAGPDTPALHHPAYDFPDALLPIGATVMGRILADYLY